MARLRKPPRFLGTRGGVTTYKMWTRYYVRRKSSLTAERVREAPEFAETRRYATLLGTAAKIGSVLYRELTPNRQRKFSYQFVTGQVMKLLRSGIKEEEILREFGGTLRGSREAVVRSRERIEDTRGHRAQRKAAVIVPVHSITPDCERMTSLRMTVLLHQRQRMSSLVSGIPHFFGPARPRADG